MQNDIISKTIEEVSKLLQKKEISPVDVLAQTIERIEEVEPNINAFITLTLEMAMTQAKSAEIEILKGKYRGPLHGIPISIKDLINIKGIKTTNASAIDREFIPECDAQVIKNLKQAGAVFVGKTNLDEYANGVVSENRTFGSTKNPYNAEYSPGGSSGGSAASVAANMVLGTVGTDTGGSIRIPSSCCGLVGLKPTYGLISTEGVTPLAWSEDHVGPMARTVTDAKILFEAMLDASSTKKTANNTFFSPYQDNLKGVRIGIPKNYFFDDIDSDVEKEIQKVISNFLELGAVIKEVRIPSLSMISNVHSVICAVESATFHFENLNNRYHQFDPMIASFFKMGQTLPGTQYVSAQRTKSFITEEMVRILTEVDLLLTPTLPVPPPKNGQQTLIINGQEKDVLATLIRNTCPFNVTGLPAINVPISKNEKNLPVGFQLAAAPFQESFLFFAAYTYLENFPFK